MSKPKLPKGLPVESFDPGDLVYTAKDMEDMHAQGVREGRAAAFAEAAEVCADMAEDGRSAQLEGYTMSSDAIRAHEMCADALRAAAAARGR